VRFEDIQGDPAGQLAALAAYCGLRFTDRQLQRAAKTIQPIQPKALAQINEKESLLSRYPLAAKLGYAPGGVR